MADATGGGLVARMLAREGVHHRFTLGHLLPIYDACRRHGIPIVDVRREQTAAHILDPTAHRREGGGSLAI